jgi:hypothetical protein
VKVPSKDEAAALAKSAVAYLEALRKEGVSPVGAMTMTADYTRALIVALQFPPQEPPREPWER